jgi:hypothetical protein
LDPNDLLQSHPELAEPKFHPNANPQEAVPADFLVSNCLGLAPPDDVLSTHAMRRDFLRPLLAKNLELLHHQMSSECILATPRQAQRFLPLQTAPLKGLARPEASYRPLEPAHLGLEQWPSHSKPHRLPSEIHPMRFLHQGQCQQYFRSRFEMTCQTLDHCASLCQTNAENHDAD